MFVPDIKTVHVRDLIFVLRSEIYVYWDEQLSASHLILGVDITVDITDLSDTKPYLSEDMVNQRAMTIDRFVPSMRQAA